MKRPRSKHGYPRAISRAVERSTPLAKMLIAEYGEWWVGDILPHKLSGRQAGKRSKRIRIRPFCGVDWAASHDTAAIILDDGRHTIIRPGESGSAAMRRLMEGEP